MHFAHRVGHWVSEKNLVISFFKSVFKWHLEVPLPSIALAVGLRDRQFRQFVAYIVASFLPAVIRQILVNR
jgi:hypothetical protein